MAELSLERGLELLDRRTSTIRWLMLAYIATSAFAAVATAGTLAGVIDVEAAEPDLLSAAAAFGLLAFAAAMLASIVVVGMWIYRAHANLRVAGMTGLEYSPGWAVGWFFIPIANLFKPFQAMRELWNVSHGHTSSYSSGSEPKLVIWWGLWIVGSILSNLSFRFDGENAGAGAIATGLSLDLVSTLVLAAAAWFLLQIITDVNSAQRSMIGLEATFA